MDGKTFDLEAVYDAEIFPLMAKIIDVCNKHHLPMLATFLYRSDPEGVDDGEDTYCTTSMSFDDHQRSHEMKTAYSAIMGSLRPPALKITTRNAEGTVTKQEVIL